MSHFIFSVSLKHVVEYNGSLRIHEVKQAEFKEVLEWF